MIHTHLTEGASHRQLYSGRGWLQIHMLCQGSQQGLGPTTGARAAAEALVIGMHYHGCWLLLWAHGSGAGDGNQARGMQVHQLHNATSDRKTESHLGPQAAPGTLTVDMLFHGSWCAPQAGT